MGNQLTRTETPICTRTRKEFASWQSRRYSPRTPETTLATPRTKLASACAPLPWLLKVRQHAKINSMINAINGQLACSLKCQLSFCSLRVCARLGDLHHDGHLGHHWPKWLRRRLACGQGNLLQVDL